MTQALPLTAALSGLLCGSAMAGPAPLTLVREGAPQATIILASQPTRVAEFAALELQHHVKLITGATLSVARTGEGAGGVALFVGDSAGACTAGVDASALGFEEYVVRFGKDTIVLAGHDDPQTGEIVYDMDDLAKLAGCPDYWAEHGTMHAVYDFLERCCGVRWLNQTEFGTVVPRSSTLTVKSTTDRRRHSLTQRGAGSILICLCP